MTDFHPDISLVAGDDWVIEGTLLADDGSALDLTNGVLSWRLLDGDGNPVSVNATITIVEPATAQGHDHGGLCRHGWSDAWPVCRFIARRSYGRALNIVEWPPAGLRERL